MPNVTLRGPFLNLCTSFLRYKAQMHSESGLCGP